MSNVIIMLTGTLAKEPETRTSKAGHPFAVASIRVQTAEGDVFTSITAFGSLADTLAGLAKGDPVTIIGTGRVTTYQGKDNETKAGLSVTASRIVCLTDHQAPPKAPRPKSDSQRSRRTEEFLAPPARGSLRQASLTRCRSEDHDHA
jgi:single-stranded DNA-binding protein